MPGGTLLTRELRYPGEAPGSVQARLLEPLSSGLSHAGYKLADHGPETIRYERRYLPANARNFCLVVIVLVLGANFNSPNAGIAVLGWVAIGFLVFYRRREALAVTLRAVDGGTSATIAGHVNGKGRAVIDELLPPSPAAAQPAAGQEPIRAELGSS
jgi:hypothetical protein